MIDSFTIIISGVLLSISLLISKRLFKNKGFLLLMSLAYFNTLLIRLLYVYMFDPYDGDTSGSLLYLTDATHISIMTTVNMLEVIIACLIAIVIVYSRRKKKVSSSIKPIKRTQKSAKYTIFAMGVCLSLIMYDVIVLENNVFFNPYNYNDAGNIVRNPMVIFFPYQLIAIIALPILAFKYDATSVSSKVTISAIAILYFIFSLATGSKSMIIAPIIFYMIKKRGSSLITYLIKIIIVLFLAGIVVFNRGIENGIIENLDRIFLYFNNIAFSDIPLIELGISQLLTVLDNSTWLDSSEIRVQYLYATFPGFLNKLLGNNYIGDAGVYLQHLVSVGGINILASLTWAYGIIGSITIVIMLMVYLSYIDFKISSENSIIMKSFHLFIVILMFSAYGYGISMLIKLLYLTLLMVFIRRYVK